MCSERVDENENDQNEDEVGGNEEEKEADALASFALEKDKH